MREFLLRQMIATANGDLETANAKSICNFAQQIYNTVKLEMAFAQIKTKLDVKQIDAVKWTSESKTPKLRAA